MAERAKWLLPVFIFDVPFCAKCYVRIADGIRFRGHRLAKNFSWGLLRLVDSRIGDFMARASCRTSERVRDGGLEDDLKAVLGLDLHKLTHCSNVGKAIHAVGNRVAFKTKTKKSYVKQ